MVTFSTGGIFDEALGAVGLLNDKGFYPALYTFPTVKPIDRELIEECAKRYELIVTVEEHTVVGGFGSAVSEVLSELRGTRAVQMKIGLNDTYSCIVGAQKYLRNEYGMSADKIANRINEYIGY